MNYTKYVMRGQTRPCWGGGLSQTKESELFQGEVFFLLTCTLMDGSIFKEGEQSNDSGDN